MNHSIPFSIPAEYAEGLIDGSLERIGALLKERATGQIVAHVQETGVAQQALSKIGQAPFSPLATLNLASAGYSNIQLSQLKALVEGMQVLQYANLGVAIAGIGVSVIGFSLINQRLKGIESQISLLTNKMDQHFQALFERELRSHYSKMYVLFEKADLAHTLTNSTAEWRNVASQLADESGFFKGEIIHLLNQEKFNTELFTPLVQSIALCDAGRIESLLLANELPAAHKAASVMGESYSEAFDGLSPFKLANKISLDQSEGHDNSRSHDYQGEMETLVQGVRDVTDAALTKPLLLETLMEKEISGYDYISSVKEEKEHPIVLLKNP